MPLELAPEQATAQNLPWDVDETNECSTTTIQESQLSTQMVQAPLVSEVQLRDASRKPKSRKYQVPSNTTAHIRECHHLAEKQYRTRLKSQFESLLAVLPASRTRTLADRDSMPSSGQVLSRGQVLDLARERILELEEEIEILISATSNGYIQAGDNHSFDGPMIASLPHPIL
ncbi:hypothetical protein FOC1_g10006464 [Fusarium oxysporum f. sp. cubense race 1]|uniref:BHLH domain-containing protein n=1 Tax=Fusarium oxysporum f. sp. cubense (strain race 1) TaxID=1229664 RepID=N4UAB7_FUSC1|nr:hypothetical protein FOC1_g10006464 [Fusarium oxysporum f. sp. cubense race 1]